MCLSTGPVAFVINGEVQFPNFEDFVSSGA